MINLLAFNVPFISIFALMITAIITPLLPLRKRLPEKVSCYVIGFVMILSLWLLFSLTNSGQNLSFNFPMGHFPAPWGNELRVGPLEAVMAFFFCIAMLLSLTGNFASTAEDISPARRQIFCVLVNLLMAALLALTYTNDLFTAYVFIEINTMAACAVVAVKEGASTVRASIRYLIMSLVGSGGWLTSSALYVNPVPAGLVLTGIVVSVSVTAFSLALALKLYENYGTLNIDEALLKMTEEQLEIENTIEKAEEDVL